MVFKIIFLGMLLIIAIFTFVELLKNYKVYKKAKEKELRRRKFFKKMKELEIK